MFRRLHERLLDVHPQLPVYLAAVALSGAAGGMWETSFSNYLNDTFHIGAAARGMIEFPRELPGLLTAVSAGLLCFLPEARMGAVAFVLAGLGMVGVAALGQSWAAMLGFVILWSVGTHLSMPVASSLTMSLASERSRGRRLGQVGAVGRLGTIAGCAVVWLLGRAGGVRYSAIFLTGACAFFVAASLLSGLRVGIRHPRPRLVVSRRYWLYYVLELLMGARKQVFLTFGPWVLVKIFGQPPATFAKLWIVTAIIGLFFAPTLGRMIDRFGERTILVADALVLFAVCVAYGFAEGLLGHNARTLFILYAAYVIDQLSFDTGMARATFISKTVETPTHLAPTLSLGVSINHAVSMSVPTAGGLLWERNGYPWVFLCAGILSVIYMGFAALVRTTPGAGVAELQEAARQIAAAQEMEVGREQVTRD
ncbi:MAG: MFS transporter [Armatimonadetes bacterium]|nr:MFS transporter [Armatimonadota bacterium]